MRQGKKKYELCSILYNAGVGLATRKIGANIKNTNEFTYDGAGKFKIIQKSTFKNSEVEFELGKEFETTTVDGRKVRVSKFL